MWEPALLQPQLRKSRGSLNWPQDAPFFTVKLNVKVLPCIILFSGGVAVDRTVGFDEFGAKDDFMTGKQSRTPSALCILHLAS
jgi:hypothetical protein